MMQGDCANRLIRQRYCDPIKFSIEIFSLINQVGFGCYTLSSIRRAVEMKS